MNVIIFVHTFIVLKKLSLKGLQKIKVLFKYSTSAQMRAWTVGVAAVPCVVSGRPATGRLLPPGDTMGTIEIHKDILHVFLTFHSKQDF